MADQPILTRTRESWGGRGAFVLAAIGSAVGLGNLWGFPYKLYTYGGGAFLIPYFIAMLIMGIPLLIMEFSVGHWAQQSPPGAFGRVLNKYRFVGWWLVALAFVIITYYAVILSYCVIYLIVSLGHLGGAALPWAAKHPDIVKSYYFDGMLGYGDTMVLGIPAPMVLLGAIVSWVLIYFCLFRGVKWVSKVVLLTVPLPWIMLVILTVKGLTMDGAIEGLEFYLEPRWEKLLEADTWRWAFGQVFFSMSLGFAVMLSYASFLHRRSDLNNNALIIGIGDLGTSFVAGIAVFSMLGGMAYNATQVTGETMAVTDLVPGDSTVALSFVVFPYGLSQLPLAGFFSAVFFIALLTLGIDSAFSIVEACLASVCDTRPTWPRRIVLPVICLIGLGAGVFFTCRQGGLNLLGLTDGLINGPFGILIVAMAEALVVGWAWGGSFLRKMREHANERSDWKLHGWWDVTVRYVVPGFLAVLIVWSISDEVHSNIDTYRSTSSEPSQQLRQIWPEYEPLKARFDEVDQTWKQAEARAYRAQLDGDESVQQDAEREAAALSLQREAAQAELAPLAEQVSTLTDQGAVRNYAFPWALVIGSLIFLAIPVVAWISRRNRDPVDVPAGRTGGVRSGVAFVAIVMVIAVIAIELGQALGWFAQRRVDYAADGELNATAYLFIAVALVVIFGGLAWCFWRAMLAAGRQDTDMGPDTSA